MSKKQLPPQEQTLPATADELQKELAALHASEARYRLLFDTSPNALFLIGKDGHFLDANQTALDWYGYSLDEFKRMTVADLAASKELSHRAVGKVQRAVQGPTHFEWRHRRKNGHELPVEINTTPVKIGEEACTFAIVRDITERKLAEDALHASEKEYRTLFDAFPEAIAWIGLDGRVVECNDATAELARRPKKEIIGKHFTKLGVLTPRDISKYLKLFSQLIAGKQKEHLEVEIQRGDERRILEVFVNLLTDEGHFRAIQVIVRDITERKQAEEALAQVAHEWQTTFDAANDAIWLLDKDQRVVRSNKKAEQFFQRPCSEIIGLHCWEIVHDMSGPISECPLLRARQSLQREGMELQAGEKWFMVNVDPLLEVAGQYAGAIHIVRDITERKQAENALRDLSDHLTHMFTNSPTIVYELRIENGQAIPNWISANIEPVLGFQAEEALRADWWPEHIHPQDRERAVADLEHLFDDFYQHEYRFLRKDGREIWMHDEHRLLRGADNKPREIIGAWTDITERKKAEEALRESEDKFKYVFDHSILGKSITQASGEINVNQAFCEMLGYSAEELQNEKWQEITHPDDLDLTQTEINALLAGQRNSTHFIKRYLHKNGSVIWTEVGSTLRRDPDGKPLYFMTFIKDITARKQAEDALRHAERRASALIENAPDGIVFVSPQGNFTFVSPSAYKLFGYNASELSRLSPNELTHPEDLPIVLETLGGLMQNPASVPTLQYRFRHKDGRWLWIESTFSNLIAESTIEAIVINFRDITERKLAEEKLRESEERFSTIFRVNPAAVALTRMRDNQLIDVNQAWLEMTGYKRAQVVGHTANELNLWIDFSQREQMVEMLRKEGRAIGETKIRRKSGEIWDVLMSGEIIELTGEQYLLTMAQNITERKRIEAEVRQLNVELEQHVEERTRELREAQEKLVRQEKLAVLGQLAGGVGHELRNPLSVIANATYLLKLVQTEASPQVKEYLGIIDQETHTAEQIISDLLEFSRTKSVDREPVSVKEMLQHVLERFPAPETVTVEFKLPADLPPVFADPRHMQQVFGNLVVNACQAMGESGMLTLSAKKEGEEIAISVVDTGTGITPENIKKLFEPLFTTKAKGIGLGLAVSRKLVEANDGRIEVQSELGKGSTFRVYLPIHHG